MDDNKIIELAADVAGLKATMVSIEDKLDNLSHKLFGNGQPGALADLRDADLALGFRIDKAENHTQWLTGVWVGASSVVIVVFALIKYIFHR